MDGSGSIIVRSGAKAFSRLKILKLLSLFVPENLILEASISMKKAANVYAFIRILNSRSL